MFAYSRRVSLVEVRNGARVDDGERGEAFIYSKAPLSCVTQLLKHRHSIPWPDISEAEDLPFPYSILNHCVA